MKANAMESGKFKLLNEDQLTEINGGGFAYDVGRVIRFFIMAAPGNNPAMTSYAINDWVANGMLNEEPGTSK
jgi:bacteriocin-like protein